MSKQTSEAPKPQVLLFSAQCLGTRSCCSGAGCRIQVYTSETSAKICFVGKKKKEQVFNLLAHAQTAGISPKLKKNTLKRSEPWQVLQTPSWNPPLACVTGSQHRAWRKGCKAFHTQLLCLPLKLSAPAARLYLCSGTVLNITVPFPSCDPEACRLPQLNQRVEILHLWKFSWNSVFFFFLSTERLLCVL